MNVAGPGFTELFRLFKGIKSYTGGNEFLFSF